MTEKGGGLAVMVVAHISCLIRGLVLNGKLDEAYRFVEMKEKVKTVTA